MYKFYYVNKVINDGFYHEIHTEDCKYFPSKENRLYLGFFNNCNEAINKAKEALNTQIIDGCFWCSRPCHRE